MNSLLFTKTTFIHNANTEVGFTSSEHLPSVDMNVETGICVIEGECVPLLEDGITVIENEHDGEKAAIQNISEFFEIIKGWLSAYIETVGGVIELHLNLVYVHESSQRHLLELFKLLEHYQLTKNAQVSVFWHYDEADLDSEDLGEDYASDVQIPFTLVPYQPNID